MDGMSQGKKVRWMDGNVCSLKGQTDHWKVRVLESRDGCKVTGMKVQKDGRSDEYRSLETMEVQLTGCSNTGIP